MEIGFHPSDPVSNPPGSSCVAYLSVENLTDRRSQLAELGGTPHRDPPRVSAHRWIAQLADHFGNVYGLDGPAQSGDDRSRP